MKLRRMWRRFLAHGAMNVDNSIGHILTDEYIREAICVWYLYRLHRWGK